MQGDCILNIKTYLKENKIYFSKTLKIAWPVIFETLMLSLVSLIDSAMVGSLGSDATAAIGINMGVSWLINSLPAAITVGGAVLVAYNTGAKRVKDVSLISSQIMGICLIFSATVCLIVMLLSAYIPIWMGAEKQILPNAVFYLRAISSVIIFSYMGQAASAVLRGAGDTKSPMFAGILTNLINVTLNFLLIYESRKATVLGLNFTIPGVGLGVRGAAIASAAAMLVSGAVLVFIVFSKSAVRAKITYMFKISPATLKRVLELGLPAMAERLSLSMGQVIYQRMISFLGSVTVSAHFLATQAESISYMPAMGFSISASTLIGQSFGAGDSRSAQRYATINLILAFFVGIGCMLLFLFLPKQILSLFTPDAEVIAEGVGALMIIAVVEPFFTSLIVLAGILRGSGDTKFPLYSSLAGMWCVRLLSSAFFIYVLQLGLTGAWAGMGCDLILRSLVLYLRYRKKGWLESGKKILDQRP